MWRRSSRLICEDGNGNDGGDEETAATPDLITHVAVNRFVGEYNVCDAKPFIWRANPDDIIAARNRGFQTLKSIH